MRHSRHYGFLALIICLLAVSLGCSRDPAAREAKALERGKGLLAQKDYPRALLDFKNAAQSMPKDAEPYYQAGLASLGLGDVRNAIAYFKKALQLNPKHTGAQLKMAGLMASTRNKDLVREAEKRLTEMLPAAPSNTELLDTLAFAEVQLGKPGDAIQHLQQALEKSPAHLASAIALAQMKLAQKDAAGAEEVMKQAVRQNPKSAPAALALAQFYLRINRRDDGLAEIHRALGLDPKNGPALFALAGIQVQAGQKDAAEQTYARLSALAEKQYKPLHAIFLFQTGKTDAAIAEFAKLAKADPEDRDARTRLVVAYLATGKPDPAQKVLADALKRNAKDVDALFQRSQLYLRSGNTSGAEADLRQVLHFKSDSGEAHFALARLYAATRSPLLQRQELNEAVRLNPRLVPARAELVATLLRERNAASALDVINQTPADQRNLLPVVVSRIWAMLFSGDEAGARKELDAGLAVARVPDLLLPDASLKMAHKDYAGAQAAVEEILRQNPVDLRALRLLLDNFSAQKKDPEAERRLTALASQQPKSAPIQQLLGEWMLKHGKPDQARLAFQAAKTADPRYVNAYISLAALDLAQNNPGSARQNLNAVLSADAKNEAARLMLADLEMKAGNTAAAIEHLRAVADTDDKNVMALNNLAYLLAKTDPDGALKYAQRADEIAPDTPAIEDTLGWVYYRKGLYDNALTHLKIAVEKGGTPRRQFHLGMAYVKAGNPATGRQIVATALKSDPALATSERDW
jgi:tetratricopeptide (TPR) repeat protein